MSKYALIIGICFIAWQFMEPYQRYEVRKVGYNFFSTIAEKIKPAPTPSDTFSDFYNQYVR